MTLVSVVRVLFGLAFCDATLSMAHRFDVMGHGRVLDALATASAFALGVLASRWIRVT